MAIVAAAGQPTSTGYEAEGGTKGNGWSSTTPGSVIESLRPSFSGPGVSRLSGHPGAGGRGPQGEAGEAQNALSSGGTRDIYGRFPDRERHVRAGGHITRQVVSRLGDVQGLRSDPTRGEQETAPYAPLRSMKSLPPRPSSAGASSGGTLTSAMSGLTLDGPATAPQGTTAADSRPPVPPGTTRPGSQPPMDTGAGPLEPTGTTPAISMPPAMPITAGKGRLARPASAGASIPSSPSSGAPSASPSASPHPSGAARRLSLQGPQPVVAGVANGPGGSITFSTRPPPCGVGESPSSAHLAGGGPRPGSAATSAPSSLQLLPQPPPGPRPSRSPRMTHDGTLSHSSADSHDDRLTYHSGATPSGTPPPSPPSPLSLPLSRGGRPASSPPNESLLPIHGSPRRRESAGGSSSWVLLYFTLPWEQAEHVAVWAPRHGEPVGALKELLLKRRPMGARLSSDRGEAFLAPASFRVRLHGGGVVQDHLDWHGALQEHGVTLPAQPKPGTPREGGPGPEVDPFSSSTHRGGEIPCADHRHSPLSPDGARGARSPFSSLLVLPVPPSALAAMGAATAANRGKGVAAAEEAPPFPELPTFHPVGPGGEVWLVLEHWVPVPEGLGDGDWQREGSSRGSSTPLEGGGLGWSWQAPWRGGERKSKSRVSGGSSRGSSDGAGEEPRNTSSRKPEGGRGKGSAGGAAGPGSDSGEDSGGSGGLPRCHSAPHWSKIKRTSSDTEHATMRPLGRSPLQQFASDAGMATPRLGRGRQGQRASLGAGLDGDVALSVAAAALERDIDELWAQGMARNQNQRGYAGAWGGTLTGQGSLEGEWPVMSGVASRAVIVQGGGRERGGDGGGGGALGGFAGGACRQGRPRGAMRRSCAV
eukprot:jgi/Mesvir1/6162/Mv00857-RA.1